MLAPKGDVERRRELVLIANNATGPPRMRSGTSVTLMRTNLASGMSMGPPESVARSSKHSNTRDRQELNTAGGMFWGEILLALIFGVFELLLVV